MRWLAPVLLILACGGETARPAPEWTSRAPLAGGPRQEHAVVALDGEVYVIGGFDAARAIVATVEAYDPELDRWRPRAPLPVPAHHVNAAVVGGKIYVLGLLQGTGFTAAGLAFAYDPIADEWTERAAMPPGSERGASGVAALGAKIYVGGGLRGPAVADLSAYDTVTDEWEPLPPLPEPRDHLVAAALAGRIYFIGGRRGGIGAHSSKVFAYDPAAPSFAEAPPMPTSRGGMAAAVIDTAVIVAGGEGNASSPSGVFPQVERFTPDADVWDVLAPMRTPRHGAGGAAVGHILFVPGGAISDGFGAVATVDSLEVPALID